ncbi:PD-(D/E)XK nuclease family protein [Actinocorallia libanotica]
MPQATSNGEAEQKPSALLRTSHSALSDFLSCPEKFRQSRILKRKETPAWWSAGGTAVHSVTEEFDRWYLTAPSPEAVEGFSWEGSFKGFFDRQVEETQEKTGVATSEWRAAGASNARRVTEDEAFWRANGPQYAKNWALWRAQNPQWSIWGTPSREPAIELEFNLEDFGGAGLRAYVDRVMVNEAGEVAVIDLKAGSSAPDLLDQLLIYAGCMEIEYGVRPTLGAFFNCRKGDKVYLERLDVEHVTDTMERVSTFITQADAGEYLARPGEQCAFRCGYAAHCSSAQRLTSFWRKKAGLE